MSQSSYTIPVAVQRLVNSYQRQKKDVEIYDNVPKVKINQAIGRVAFFYEKIRNTLDYKEENLLIKTMIERIIRRRFVAGVDPTTIAKPLVTELIRSGYIANNTLPELIVEQITTSISKYAHFLSEAIPPLDPKEREQVFDWSVRMLACEIEDVLSYTSTRRGMVEFMYLTMLERVQFTSRKVTEDERKVQIYTAVLKTYTQYDFDLTSYHLLTFFYPDWKAGKADTVAQVAQHVLAIQQTLADQINNPLQERLLRQFKKVNILFVILHELITTRADALDLLQQAEQLDEAVANTVEKKYKEIKSKLRRRSLRSIIYLFITKMMLALVLEVPYDYYIVGEVNRIPLMVNVFFHPTLLFVIALAIHIPAKENTKRIVAGIHDLVYNYKGKEIVYRIRPKTKQQSFSAFFFRVLYLLAFVITFGILFLVLKGLHFNWVGGTLFVMFLTLVSFFGLRVRQLARDVVVLDRKDNLISVMIDFFSIPIVRAGRWLSIKFSKLNVFVFVLDVIIEAPFKLIIDIIEDWLDYIREKREEIYD